MGRRSFPAWNERALVETVRIHGLADSAKRLKPLLAALALIEEVLDRGFDELIQIPVLAGGQFILDPIFDLRGQVHVHGRSSCFDFAANGTDRNDPYPRPAHASQMGVWGPLRNYRDGGIDLALYESGTIGPEMFDPSHNRVTMRNVVRIGSLCFEGTVTCLTRWVKLSNCRVGGGSHG